MKPNQVPVITTAQPCCVRGVMLLKSIHMQMEMRRGREEGREGWREGKMGEYFNHISISPLKSF